MSELIYDRYKILPPPPKEELDQPITPVLGSGEQFTGHDAYETVYECIICRDSLMGDELHTHADRCGIF